MMLNSLPLCRSIIFLAISLLVSCGGDVTSTDSPSGTQGAGTDSSNPPMSASASRGRLLYESLEQGCLGCHGADGQSSTFKVIDLEADVYQHSSAPGVDYSLEEYIELWMPVGNISLCDSSCSEDIAAFIRSMDNSGSEPVEPDPITQPPNADATASQNLQGFAPLIVSFDAGLSSDSDGFISSYEWSFGDGSVGSGETLSHQYDVPGTYQAQLTVMDNEGNADTDTLTIIVQENAAPVAQITSSVLTGTAPLTVQFSAQNSTDDQGIVSYQWTLLSDIISSTDSAEYVFSEPGLYEVQLRVEDSAGLNDVDTQVITVTSPDINLPPVADASNSTNLSGPAPLEVYFDASASTDDRNQIVRYVWDFGNGQTAEGVQATREYDAIGDYTVRLTVEDEEGGSSQTELVVSVINQSPQAVISTQGSTVAFTPHSLSFSSADSSDDFGITRWEWYFDDDNEVDSTEANPSYIFEQAGNHNVRLRVFDEQGASSLSNTILVQTFDSDVFAANRYDENCSLCHGDNGEGGVGPSLINEWTMPELEPSVQNMVGLYGNCQGIEEGSCVDAITTYIMDQFARDPQEPPVNACLNTDDHLISVPIKALTQDEFFNTVDEVFSVGFSDEEKLQFNLPLDTSGTRYSTDSTLRVLRGPSADPNVLDDLYPALTSVIDGLVDELTASHFQTNYSAIAGCSFSSVGSSESCRSAYHTAVLSKAFRRSVLENDYALENAASAYDIFISDGLNPQDAFIQSIASYVILSPEFIFHSYRGQSANDSYQLTNQELAHKISYLIWGAPADTDSLSLDWNSLLAGENDAQLDAELVRLFSDSRSNYFINTFLHEWLQLETDVEQQLSVTDDANRSQEFAEAIKGESEHFIRYLITQNESINSVINADYTFMNTSLADFYQVSVSGLTSEFSRVNFDSVASLSNRQGLLTQANFLTTGTKSDRPGSVHRGVTILKDVMCHVIGPPSGEAPDISGVDRTLHTESALFRMVTETPGSSCEGCHRTINPISFPFEAFDRFGRHPWALSIDGSLPEYSVYESVGVEGNPDANGPVEKADTFYLDVRDGNLDFGTNHGHSIAGSFDDHQGLINLINQSPAFGQCLNDNFYDFIVGTSAERGLNPSSIENEAQHLSQTCSKQIAMDGVDGIRTLISNLLKRPEFRIIRRN